jgi:hypothetical protein
MACPHSTASQASRFFHARFFSLFILFFIFYVFWPASASALTADQIVQPWRNDLLLRQEALAEIKQRATLHQELLRLEKDKLELLLKALDPLEKDLALNQELRIKRWKIILAAAQKLADPETGKLNAPVVGPTSLDELKNQQHREQKIIASQQQRVAKGQERFHLPGVGWVTRNRLANQLADNQKKAAAFLRQMAKGSWAIDHPLLGKVDQHRLERDIASLQKKIAGALQDIREGSFRVQLPNLGWVTRKQLEKKIADLKARIEKLKKENQDGNARFHRPLTGWIDKNKFKKTQSDLRSKLAEHQKASQQGLIKINFSGETWLDRTDLQKLLADSRGGRQDLTRRFADHQYSLPCGEYGRLTWEDIDERLKDLHLKPQEKAALEQCRQNLTVAFSMEDKLMELDQQRLAHWIAAYPRQIDIQTQAWQRELSDLELLPDEFPREQSTQLTGLERQLDYLQDCLTLLP